MDHIITAVIQSGFKIDLNESKLLQTWTSVSSVVTQHLGPAVGI